MGATKQRRSNASARDVYISAYMQPPESRSAPLLSGMRLAKGPPAGTIGFLRTPILGGIELYHIAVLTTYAKSNINYKSGAPCGFARFLFF